MEKTYSIAFRYSRDGKSYVKTSTSVKATSEANAKKIIKEKFPNAKDFVFMAVR